ncbi:pleckstrin homology domain-containing family J member 1 isoform X4 [Saimiri boliviensis]|uniref:pleckstrin homology domain-containing family J member 1 isoform X4 n=1 Tax=Saimiri boliviensis TaxID=27679 RepID=UPI003D775BC0
MRYNEKELQALSRQPAEMAAELGMRGPKKGSGFVEDPERKYHFECSSEEQCQEWMEALRRASYEFMRRSLIFYRNEIQKVTGKDPLEQFGISEEARFQLSGLQLPKSAGTTGTSPHTQPSHLDLQREVFGLETSKA